MLSLLMLSLLMLSLLMLSLLMLSLLLDEQISPQVVASVSALRAGAGAVGPGVQGIVQSIHFQSLYAWRGGALTGTDDALVLQGAAEDGLTLVTYDLKTIPPVLAEWGASGRSHGGVIFVDDRSIAPSDFGGLARALLACLEAQGAWDWTDRIVYLKPAGMP